jgi:hypothetical protein
MLDDLQKNMNNFSRRRESSVMVDVHGKIEGMRSTKAANVKPHSVKSDSAKHRDSSAKIQE